jgi:putative transposase
MHTSVSLYHRHRCPDEIISHCVWLYFRFPLSFRDVEEMLAIRGVSLSYETVREWCLKFGQTYANGLRHKSPRPGDRWYLDEVFLWRAVDQDGDVLDIMVQSKRDQKAAKKFFRKLLKGLRYVPRVLITDKLKSYSAAKAEVLPSVEHCQQKYQNNRAENSH